jgi:hypothetical protein
MTLRFLLSNGGSAAISESFSMMPGKEKAMTMNIFANASGDISWKVDN